MRTYIDGREISVYVDVTQRLVIELEPAVWQVTADGRSWCVTKLNGLIEANGLIRFGCPRGVTKNPLGIWGAAERIMPHTVISQRRPEEVWAAIPAAIREVVQETYLIAHHDIPAVIGEPA